jgi:hypothetical protein
MADELLTAAEVRAMTFMHEVTMSETPEGLRDQIPAPFCTDYRVTV